MGLKPHEIEAAHMEATVLKNLSHPNIGFLDNFSKLLQFFLRKKYFNNCDGIL
jgi:hypothetical protein